LRQDFKTAEKMDFEEWGNIKKGIYKTQVLAAKMISG
jgi:hypothetical protein